MKSSFVHSCSAKPITVELTTAAVADLNDFSQSEIEQIYFFLLSLVGNPLPGGIQTIRLAEAVNGLVHLYETFLYTVCYEIFETQRLVRVMAIFKKISLN